MESCLNYKPERVGAVVVEDLRKDLFVEFSKMPTSQESVLLEKEHLQVYLRIRPFTSTESGFGESQDCISIEPPETVVLKAPRASLAVRQSEKLGPQVAQRFQFSKVYGPDATQREIFGGTTKTLVKDVLKGENSLVFTYGVTNAGKTFTFLGPEADGGILPRSLNLIFNSIEGRMYTQNNIKPHRCVDFTRLTNDQQEEEATNKKKLLRRFKESGLQKSTCNTSNSTCSSILEGSSYTEMDGESLCLEEDSHIKFSVWVSFCEIYNENIHDLLDFVSSGSQRRSALRLCQDVKGNTFVKDLTWVQVNGADEAYKVLKIGRKNQSFSSTKLNSVSSRSHSIFSIRVIRLEDVGVPRVQTISELSLCDLAGSERCAKTHNRGERLKEAGNINTSLLTLGKCINALRLNQTHSKFNQHIPFRESKLTHYLQGFFCGRGKACMIVNINQCASMYDETLNVLKFSAVAQKVVVLNPKPVFHTAPKRSARDLSMILNNVDRKEWARRSTLIGWETSLEDVQEDEDDEDMEEEEEECDEKSMMETTVLEAEDQELHKLHQKIQELQEKFSNVESEKLAMESLIREEVTTEFMELFSNMEKDYNERLQREREIAEERAERRLEIFKNLTNETLTGLAATCPGNDTINETKMECLDGMMEAMQDDLAEIRRDAEVTQTCLENVTRSPGVVESLRARLDKMAEELLESQQLLGVKTEEMDTVLTQLQKTCDQLLMEKAATTELAAENRALSSKLSELQHMTDEMSTKLRALEAQELSRERESDCAFRKTIEALRKECEAVVSTSQEKNRRIEALETELGCTREEICRLENTCEELRRERDARRDETQVAVDHSEAERVKEVERELAEGETRCIALREKLQQCQSELARVKEALREARVAAEEVERRSVQEAQRGLREMEEELALKDAELNTKAQEVLRLEMQMTEDQNKMKSLQADLQQKESHISDLHAEVSRGSTHADRLQTEVTALTEAIGELRQKLRDVEEERDGALSAKRSQEQTAAQLNTVSSESGTASGSDPANPGVDKGQDTTGRRTDSSVLSTGSEKDNRFPKPEVEISFTPLKPNRVNVRRAGCDESVTVKIRNTARKRKSSEVESSVQSENRKNQRLQGTSMVSVTPVESPVAVCQMASPLTHQVPPKSLKRRKDGTLQKIGDFIQSSPTLLGSKAKKIMAMVKSPEPQPCTETSNKPKRSKRKLFKAQISSPLDIPPHPIIVDQDDKESDHLIIRRKLRTRPAKRQQL